ncbi:MAG: hypothetical protein RLZ26_2001 [Pseudomonadota bacterium]|jgi:CDP-diacylglycerol--serine O-phosphatidyltransferase
MLDHDPFENGRTENLTVRQILPNAVTILGLCAGLMALRFVQAGRVDLAVMLILLAGVLDGLDGIIARRLDATSKMGAELDSLADFLNFGVAPAVIVFEVAMSASSPATWVPVLVFTVCACLRLARFNVDRGRPETAGRLHFIGVPTPAGALLALWPTILGQTGAIDPSAHPEAYGLWMAFVGLLMISKVPTQSSKTIRIPRERAIPVLIGVAVVMGLLITRFWVTISLVALAYTALLARDIALWVRARR